MRLYSYRKFYALATAVVLTSSLQQGRAQVSNAQINGTVHDPTGAVIPDASVVLHNEMTGVDTSTTTNAAGVYIIQQILPDTYTLRVSKAEFAATQLQAFRLVVNQASVLDVTLSLGSSQQSVTVKAEGAEVQSSTAELGLVLTAKQIQDLPTGRNVQSLTHLTPGVSEITTGQSSIPSINGQINRTSIFLLDGISDTAEVYSQQALNPIPETIDQFKVESHNDSATLGGVLGGIINQTSKSGTNDLHGQIYEVEQNSALNARNYFQSVVNPLFHDHLAGGVAGGPVWIPKLYNGRNRTFFFFGYQYEEARSPSLSYYRVPTAAELNGDLSDLPEQLYNPFTTRPDPNHSGAYIRDPFPNNQIPANLLYPGYQYLARTLLPQPVFTGVGQFNAINRDPNNNQIQSVTVRIDHKFSERDTIFGRYSGSYNPASSAGGIPSLLNLAYTRADTSAFGWVHTFGPSAVLQVQFGTVVNYAETSSRFTNLPAGFTSQVGFSPNALTPFLNGQSYVPGFIVPGFFFEGEAYGHNEPANDLHFRANYSKLLKNHLLQFGGEYNKLSYQFTQGQLYSSFAAAQTGNPQNYGPTGNPLASFLLNVPDTAVRRDEIESVPASTGESGLYIQDSWKALDNLVINIGLRYDRPQYPSAGTAKDGNNAVGDIDYGNGTYILQALAPPCAQVGRPPCIPTPGGVLPAHVVVSPNGKILKNRNFDFQPRLGIAYRLDARTAIRAAGGLFFDDLSGTTQQAQAIAGSWPSLGLQAAANLNFPSSASPAPTITGTNSLPSALLPAPTPFSQGNQFFFDPNLRNAYSYQWNLGVQRQIGSSLIATVNYVGSTSRRDDVGGRYNVAPTPGPGDPQTRFPFPYLPVPFSYDRSAGSSNYHALEASLEKRYANGLALTASYTYSKSLDYGSSGLFSIEGFSVENPYNLQRDYGVSNFDIPHNLVVSWNFDLPFGTGKRFSTGHRAVDTVLGNWQWNGIANIRSGVPYNLTVAGDIANTGNFGYERTDTVGNYRNFHPTVREYFNTSAFAAPRQYTFGDTGRNLLRSQFVHVFNMGLFKQIPITERYFAEVRAEAYNVFNTPIFNAPDAEFTSQTFGQVLSAQAARTLQIGGRVHF